MSKELLYEKQLAYIHGRIECELEFFAQSLGRPKQDVTSRVAALLLDVGSGLAHQVSDMRENTAKPDKATRKMEVAKRAPSNKTSAASTRKVKKSTYWSRMTPLQRSQEMKRRRLKAVRNLANAA